MATRLVKSLIKDYGNNFDVPFTLTVHLDYTYCLFRQDCYHCGAIIAEHPKDDSLHAVLTLNTGQILVPERLFHACRNCQHLLESQAIQLVMEIEHQTFGKDDPAGQIEKIIQKYIN